MLVFCALKRMLAFGSRLLLVIGVLAIIFIPKAAMASSSMSPKYFGSSCLEAWDKLDGNSTALNQLRLELELRNSGGELSCAPSAHWPNKTICTQDLTRANTTAYEELCTKGNGTMIKYDVFVSCVDEISNVPGFWHVKKTINKPFCFPAICSGVELEQWFDKDNFLLSRPAGMSCHNDVSTQEWKGQGCRNETAFLTDLDSQIMREIYPSFNRTKSYNAKSSVRTFDYRQTNITAYDAMCTANGGKTMRHDVTVRCDVGGGQTATEVILSEPRCMGTSCTLADTYDASNYIPNSDLSHSGDYCNITITEAFLARTSHRGWVSILSLVLACVGLFLVVLALGFRFKSWRVSRRSNDANLQLPVSQ